MVFNKSIRAIFDRRSSLEAAMDELKEIGVGHFIVEDEARRREALVVEIEDQRLAGKIREVLHHCGGHNITFKGESSETEAHSDYRDYSIRSGLDPDRLTDI